MINLLGHELFKLRKNRSLYIVLTLSLLLAFFMASMFASLADGGLTGNQALVLAGVATEVWIIMTAVVITSFVVAEYQKGQIRNLVMSGHSRISIYLAKYITALIVGLGLLTAVVLLITGVATYVNGWNNPEVLFELSFLGFLSMYLQLAVLYAAIIAVILFIADLTQSTAAAIGANIGLMLVFTLLASVGTYLAATGGATEDPHIFNRVSELYVGFLTTRIIDADLGTAKMVQYMCTALITAILALVGGALLFRRRDLK